MDFIKHFPTRLAYLSIFILCFFLTIPPFLNGYIVSHDILYHLNWNELFQTQFFQGDIYPRWLFDMKGGRGSPVFYFYSPLPYYCAALFSLMIPTAQSAWYSLGATYCFALFFSGLGMFWFLRSYAEDRYAYIFTIFYILFPYHVVVDLYIRFAFTEFFAIAWVPYVFIYTKRLTEGHKNAIWILSLFYALLLLSHIPTTLLITPVIVLFGFINAKKPFQRYSVLAGMSLGVALTAFYILPIIFLKEFVSIETMMVGNLSYENSFLFAGNVLNVKKSLLKTFLENLSLISIVMTISYFFAAPKNKDSIFHFNACLCCIALMYPISQMIWETLPILKIVQFPWRFYIVLSFILFMGSVSIVSGGHPRHPLARYCRFLTITILIFISALTIYHSYKNAVKKIEIKQEETITKSLQNRDGVLEYLPFSTPAVYFDQVRTLKVDRLEELFVGTQIPAKSEYTFQGEKIIARIDNRQPQIMLLNQFYFPTWEGYNLDELRTFKLTRSKEGFIEFALDKGIHNLRFSHKDTTSEIIGMAISLIAAAFIILRLAMINRKVKK